MLDDSELNKSQHSEELSDGNARPESETVASDDGLTDEERPPADTAEYGGGEADEAQEPMSSTMVEALRFRRDLNRRILSGMWPRASYVDNPANFAPSSEINFTANDYVMQCDPVDDSDPEADKSDYLGYLEELDEVDGLDAKEGGLDDADDVPANDDLLVRPRQEVSDEVLSPGYQVSRTVHPEGD